MTTLLRLSHASLVTRGLILLLAWTVAPRWEAKAAAGESGANAELECSHALRALEFQASAQPPSGRRFAPERLVDMLDLKLDVTPDFKRRTIAAKAVVRFKPIAAPLSELRLDAVDLDVRSLMSTQPVRSHHSTQEHLVITWQEPLPAGGEVEVTIDYTAEPKLGLYFRTAAMGYPPGDDHLWTQGEAHEASHWFPCYDFPNDKLTTSVTCHVPEGMTVLSNGRRVSEIPDPASGLVAVSWGQEKPHSSYLVCLVAGHLKSVESSHRGIPLAFYTPASEIQFAPNSFKDTADMMAFFESEIGVPYPWEKYFQVCVHGFHWGGMENTSLTTLNTRTLFTDATENLRSSQGLVAHELAHQWFGDLVTCKDWTHVWLNEGFATYYDLLYDAHKNGLDSMLYSLQQSRLSITSRSDDTIPIAYREFKNPNDQFTFRAYDKGAWVLHMLRSQLGEAVFRRCVQTFIERHQYGTVVTEDFNRVIEEVSGQSFDRFFDQWVYHARHPELQVSYEWHEKQRLAKITVKQVQTTSRDVVLFELPLTVRFQTPSGAEDHTFIVRNTEEDFFAPLSAPPKFVALDPELKVLAKMTLSVPPQMLAAQLEESKDVVSRLNAALELGARSNLFAVKSLARALQGDAFWAVRVEASKALRAMHTDEALEALLESKDQADARVRRQVVADLNGFYNPKSYEHALGVLRGEKNPDIVASAIEGLGGYAAPDLRERLVPYLESDSFRHSLAAAAIRAMRAQEDPGYLEPLRDALARREAGLPPEVLGSGLETLGYLARNLGSNEKQWVYELLASHVTNPRSEVQLGAIRGLGFLNEPRAIPVLERLAIGHSRTPERTASQKAIADIRSARVSGPELGALRGEVLELQRQHRDLRRELDGLNKQSEIKKAGQPSQPARPKRKPTR